MNIKQVPSPNYETNRAEIDRIVIHWIVGNLAAADAQFSGTVTQKVMQAVGANELIQSGKGTISGTANWTNDTNTQVYCKSGTVTFPTAFAEAPIVNVTATNYSLSSGVMTQLETVAAGSFSFKASITHFNPGTATQVFHWMAHGSI